jgi:SEC-C motif-containing protein
MATEAQTAANRRNAESSTGPRTKEGKSRSSRNAVTFGIYSAADFVLPEDNGLYRHFCQDFQKELNPEGPFEQTLAAEIVHAAWRLRRCSVIESNMVDPECDFQLDPMANLAFARTQGAVDRARAQSHRNLYRATAELRRLQTERQARVESLAKEFDTHHLGGLASFKKPPVAAAVTPEPPETPAAKRTQSGPPDPTQIARSQPCPCGSGVKYKRCCGRNAPGLSHDALKSAA